MEQHEVEHELRWLRRTLEGNGLPGLIEQVRLNTSILNQHDKVQARLHEAAIARRLSTYAVILSGLSFLLAVVAVILRTV
jgi:hypothetical protein